MKKSIIAAGVGAFALVTSLLCMNPHGKMYQKQKHFDSVNDVLMQMENNKILENNEQGVEKETNDFKECLSKRKRLTFSQINFEKIKIEKIEELDEKQKQSLLKDYNKVQEKLSLPYKLEKIEPVRLDIKGTYFKYKDGVKDTAQKDFIIDLVMVDEGEGMVIDYYIQHANENDSDKEGQVNVKG